MKSKKTKKYIFLLLNPLALLFLSASCSNTAPATTKISKDQKEDKGTIRKEVENPKKSEEKPSTEKSEVSTKKSESSEEKIEENPKNEAVEKKDEIAKQKGEISKPKGENPQPELDKPQAEDDHQVEKIDVKPFNPKEDQKDDDIKLARLKGYLSTLPNTLYVTTSLQNDLPLTIIHSGKGEKKDFGYVNFVKPIQDFNDTEYEAKLDFSDAQQKENKTKNPIENVGLVLSLKDNKKITSSKKIRLLYTEEQENKSHLKAKSLPESFKHIFPSFLAFALLNKEKEVISLPFFNESGYVLNNQNFGAGLKSIFAEFNNSENNNQKNKFGFDVVSAQPDDEKGELKLNFQLWKINETNGDQKEIFPKIESLTFSNLAKNSDNNYEIKLDEATTNTNLSNEDFGLKNAGENLNTSKFKKNEFIKKIIDNIRVNIKAENINNKWLKVSEAKYKNWLIFPQIQYANLDSTKLINNLKVEKQQENKISWTLNLESYLLDNNQILTPDSDFIFGEQKKTITIKGEMQLS
ncbi:LppA family lipoprotein [Mesomycoplasma hyopneumoniae]